MGQEGLKQLGDISIHASITRDVQDRITSMHSTCQATVNYKSSCTVTKHIMSLSEQLYAADTLIKGLHCWQHKSLSWMSRSDGCFVATSPNTQQSSAVYCLSQIRSYSTHCVQFDVIHPITDPLCQRINTPLKLLTPATTAQWAISATHKCTWHLFKEITLLIA